LLARYPTHRGMPGPTAVGAVTALALLGGLADALALGMIVLVEWWLGIGVGGGDAARYVSHVAALLGPAHSPWIWAVVVALVIAVTLGAAFGPGRDRIRSALNESWRHRRARLHRTALVAVLVGADLPSAHAVEVVPAFRLLTFWLPAVPGVYRRPACCTRVAPVSSLRRGPKQETSERGTSGWCDAAPSPLRPEPVLRHASRSINTVTTARSQLAARTALNGSCARPAWPTASSAQVVALQPTRATGASGAG
jgi:hypothetical protein